MKILYYFTFDNTPMTNWQKVQIFDELGSNGIDIEVFDASVYNSLADAGEALIKRLKTDSSIDIFMTPYCSEKRWDRGTLQMLKHISIPKLLIRFDNLHLVDDFSLFADVFDLVWLTSRENESLYKEKGCNTIFMPYAANPRLYQNRYTNDVGAVCFIGTPYGSRTHYINTLISEGVNVDLFYSKKRDSGRKDIKHNMNRSSKYAETFKTFCQYLQFGVGRKIIQGKIMAKLKKEECLLQGAPNFHHLDSLPFETMNEAYSNYSLSLNVLDLRSTAYLKHPVHKLHLRTFEIPMCAGLEFVSYNEELLEYFDDTEMVFFKNKDEMIEKAKYYTHPSNVSVCHDMKVRARRRAESEHAWINRFQKIFNEFGL